MLDISERIVNNFSDFDDVEIKKKTIYGANKLLENSEFDEFKAFIEKDFPWELHGVNWRKSTLIEESDYLGVACHSRYIDYIVRKYDNMFSNKILLTFDAGDYKFLISAKPKNILKIIKFVESQQDTYLTEFWVFDIEKNLLIEAYYKGYVTFGTNKKV